MSFTDAIKSGFRNYANFKGRASRREYWWWALFSLLVNGVASTVVNEDFGSLVSLALLLPSIAVAVRRMHDVSRRGWWILVPIVNLVFALTASKQEQNQWGPPPPPKV
jgi:uncharacterized membrane protein YhaH (DUF805 family)